MKRKEHQSTRPDNYSEYLPPSWPSLVLITPYLQINYIFLLTVFTCVQVPILDRRGRRSGQGAEALLQGSNQSGAQSAQRRELSNQKRFQSKIIQSAAEQIPISNKIRLNYSKRRNQCKPFQIPIELKVFSPPSLSPNLTICIPDYTSYKDGIAYKVDARMQRGTVHCTNAQSRPLSVIYRIASFVHGVNADCHNSAFVSIAFLTYPYLQGLTCMRKCGVDADCQNDRKLCLCEQCICDLSLIYR